MNGYLELGALIVKIILNLKIQDSKGLEIGKELVDFAQKIGLKEYEERVFVRKFEDVGDAIAQNCQSILEKYVPSKERQEIIISLIRDSLKNVDLDIDLMIEVKRDATSLARKLKHGNDGRKEALELDADEESIYERLLHHVATIIINDFNQMPEMSTERAGYLMSRIDSLADELSVVLSELKDIDTWGENLPKKYQHFDVQYRKNLVTQYSYVQLFGVDDLSDQMKKYKLSTSYVQMQVEIKKGEQEKQAIGTEEIFTNKRKNVWISGEAGSGKTTCLSWLAIKTASNQDIQGLSNVIPIIIELRSMNVERLSILDCIDRIMVNSTFSIPEGWFETNRDNGRILFLIDGFDEISDKDRYKIFDWINILDPENLCKKIFTSRPQVKERPILSDLTEVKMLSMKMEQVEQFIQYWHATVLRDGLRYAEDDALRLQKNLMEQIRKSTALRKLAANPLLCAIISALHSKSGMSIPKSKRELYEACCKMLLEGRDSERNVKRAGISLSYEQKKRITSKLAYQMMRNHQTEEKKEIVLKVLENMMEDMSLSSVKAELLLQYFLERTGLFQEPEIGKISFVHRSFEEYLCAIEMYRQEDWHYAEEKLVDDNWLETICLLIGFGNKKHADNIIAKTLERNGGKEDAGKALFYALEYLEGAIDVDPNLRKRVQDEMKKYIPPKRSQVDDLAKAGQLAVPYLSPKEAYEVDDRINCLLVLYEIGTVDALKVATGYLDARATDSEIAIISQLTEKIPEEQLTEERIPDEICSYYSNVTDAKMVVGEGILRCLNLSHEDSLLTLSKAEKKELVIVDAKNEVTSFLKEKKSHGQRGCEESKNLFSIPKFMADQIESLEVRGRFYDLQPIDVFHNLKSLTAYSYSEDFDIYFLNACKSFYNIEKCKVVLKKNDTFINGKDLDFMSNCEEIELVFLGSNAEVSFEYFDMLKKLKRLTVAAEYAAEFDYAGLCSVDTLEELVIVGRDADFLDFRLANYSFNVVYLNFDEIYAVN